MGFSVEPTLCPSSYPLRRALHLFIGRLRITPPDTVPRSCGAGLPNAPPASTAAPATGVGVYLQSHESYRGVHRCNLAGWFLWRHVGRQNSLGSRCACGRRLLRHAPARASVLRRLALAENAQSTSRQIFNSLHRIDFLLPSSQPSEVLTWGLIADWQRVSFYLLVLAGEALLLYLASSGIHRYLQTTTGGSTLRRKRVSAQPRSISWLDPRVAAVAQIQIRQGIRSARGKLGLLFSPFIIPMAGVVLLTREESGSFLRGLPIAPGLMLALGAIAFGLLAFQPFACNLLGSDERGLTRLLLMPLDPSRLARGKMLGISALLGMAMLLGFLGTLLVAPVGSPLDWLAVLLVGATAILVFGPFGLLLSVLLPKLALTDSWGEKGNPHPLAGLAGTLIVVPLVGIPGLTLLLMAASSHRLLWFGCGLLLWCGVCWLISRFLSHWATHLLATRREFLYNISEGR